MRAEFWVIKNYKPRKSDISAICPDSPNVAIISDFGMRGDIADVISNIKFYVNRFLSCDTRESRYLHRNGW